MINSMQLFRIEISVKFYINLYKLIRDVAQSGSAHAWGAWGRKFKSCHPDFFTKLIL